MTTKHTKQSYLEKKMRLAAKSIKGLFEIIRVDFEPAKKKARPVPSSLKKQAHKEVEKTVRLIQEYVPFYKKKKKGRFLKHK